MQIHEKRRASAVAAVWLTAALLEGCNSSPTTAPVPEIPPPGVLAEFPEYSLGKFLRLEGALEPIGSRTWTTSKNSSVGYPPSYTTSSKSHKEWFYTCGGVAVISDVELQRPATISGIEGYWIKVESRVGEEHQNLRDGVLPKYALRFTRLTDPR
jgi:hypothetical protein